MAPKLARVNTEPRYRAQNGRKP